MVAHIVSPPDTTPASAGFRMAIQAMEKRSLVHSDRDTEGMGSRRKAADAKPSVSRFKLNTNSGVTMTTYGEAFETAIMSNLAQGISEEVQCAGNTVSKFGKREDITESEKALVGHVLAHLSTVLNMIGVAEKYGADKLDEFDEENPGKLEAMSDELGESKIIKDLQDAMGMNADDIAALAALKEAAIEAEKAEAN